MAAREYNPRLISPWATTAARLDARSTAYIISGVQFEITAGFLYRLLFPRLCSRFRLLNHANRLEPLIHRRRFKLLRRSQNSGNRNRLLILAMVVATDCRSCRDVEITAAHREPCRLCLANIGRAHCPRRVRVIHHKRTPRPQAFTNQRRFPFRSALNIPADVFVRPGEVICKIRGFARPLQADENYRFRHRSNLGGRAPCSTAPSTGTYESSVPERAARSISPPRLISPRPTKSAGNSRRSPNTSSSGSVYFALATLPSSTCAHSGPACWSSNLAVRSKASRYTRLFSWTGISAIAFSCSTVIGVSGGTRPAPGTITSAEGMPAGAAPN